MAVTPFHARTVTAEPAGGPGTAPAEANGRLWNDRRPRGRELPAHARRGRASQLNDTWLTHVAGGRWHLASSPPQGSALASARTPVPSPYPVRPVSVPSRLRQCPVRTHIKPAPTHINLFVGRGCADADVYSITTFFPSISTFISL